MLLTVVFIAHRRFDSFFLGNSVNPLEQVWERRHVVFRELYSEISFNVRKETYIGNAELSRTGSGKILADNTAMLPTQMVLQGRIYSQHNMSEVLCGDWIRSGAK